MPVRNLTFSFSTAYITVLNLLLVVPTLSQLPVVKCSIAVPNLFIAVLNLAVLNRFIHRSQIDCDCLFSESAVLNRVVWTQVSNQDRHHEHPASF